MEHHCESPDWYVGGLYGGAIRDCRTLGAGVLWVDNGEYANVVAFCPWCGFKGAEPCRREGLAPEWPRVTPIPCVLADGHTGPCSGDPVGLDC